MPILVTTSRKPYRRTRRFVKELTRVIPYLIRINRGKKSLDDIRLLMIKKGLFKLLLVETARGNPSMMRFMKLSELGFDECLDIRIESLSLQIDRNVSVKFGWIKDAVFEKVPIGLTNFVRSFLLEPNYLFDNPHVGYIKFTGTNEDKIRICFLDERKRVVPPIIGGTIVYFRE